MKIGNYSIPNLRLFPNIYEDVKTIYENYQLDEPKNNAAVANLVGHKSPRSGAWLSKLADMRLYGLMEPRGIKLTPLAQQITFGTPENSSERDAAIRETVLNVPLWKALYSNFGADLPSENFWVQVQKFTGVDPLEAQKHADSVRKAYLEDIRHIKPEKEDKNMNPENNPSQINTNTANTNPTSITAMADLVRGMIITGAYDIAKQYIDFIKSNENNESASPTEE
jgi:hypothetical protein